MDIVASYASRMIAECDWCKNPIEKHTRIFRGYYKNKTRIQWSNKIYWHFACYPAQAESYLDSTPYEPKPRGRKGRASLGLTAEQKLRRTSLLVRAVQIRKAMLVAQRFTTAAIKELELVKTQKQYDKVRTDLQLVGGIPDSWRKKGW